MSEQIDELAGQRAEAMLSALPGMLRLRGRPVVIKFGGNAMTDPALFSAFARDLVFLRAAGLRPVVVHGGGPHISRMLDALGIPAEFRGGYRVTSEEAMRVVRMVLGGQVAREITAAINAIDSVALAMSGEDAGLFRAVRATRGADGQPVDLGRVGEIRQVRPGIVLDALAAGRIPVISSIAMDADEPSLALNINADRAASALAAALGAAELIMLTDVPGICERWPDLSSLIPRMTVTRLRELLPELSEGMIPKAQACIEAVEGGVGRAVIADGRAAHATLLALLGEDARGTEIIAAGESAA